MIQLIFYLLIYSLISTTFLFSQTPGQTLQKDSSAKPEEGSKKKSPHKISGAVGFTSDYRSRGISQNFHQPSILGELNYDHSSGFYLKSWGYSVDGTGDFLNNTSLEWDFYIGRKHLFLNDKATYDIGFVYYSYPGGVALNRANPRYNSLEYFVSIEYQKLELKVSVMLTDFFGINSSNPPFNWNTKRILPPNGHSYGSPYLEINYQHSLYGKWNIGLHGGYQGVFNYPELAYFDWFLNINREFEWFQIFLSYVQTNAKKAFYKVPNHAYKPHRIDLGGAGAVFTVQKTF